MVSLRASGFAEKDSPTEYFTLSSNNGWPKNLQSHKLKVEFGLFKPPLMCYRYFSQVSHLEFVCNSRNVLCGQQESSREVAGLAGH